MRVRKTILEFYREHYGGEQPFSTVREYCRNWLAARKAETSPSSYSRYEKTVSRFLEFLGETAGGGDLGEVTKGQIIAFRDQTLSRVSVPTANLCLKVIRMVFRSARRDEYLLVDPAEGVKTIKNRSQSVRRAFTLDEVRAILAVADPEWQSLIKFGLYTGQRLRDLARLLVPVATPLREHLLSIAGDNPRAPVHPRSYAIVHNQRGRVASLSNQFGELLTAAGLRAPRTHQGQGIGRDGRRTLSPLSFHSLRHTAVSLPKDAGIPDAVVMVLVGHGSAAMSLRYTHVGKESLARAAASLPEL